MSTLKTVVIFMVVAICGCEHSQPTGSIEDKKRTQSEQERAFQKAIDTLFATDAKEKTPKGQYALAQKLTFEAQICNSPDERDAKLAQAKEWCRKSAEGGYYHAQTQMGEYCRKDNKLIESYAWRGVIIYQFERMKGKEFLVPSYVKMQEMLNLDDEQLAKAKTLTAEYIEKYVDLENNGYQ